MESENEEQFQIIIENNPDSDQELIKKYKNQLNKNDNLDEKIIEQKENQQISERKCNILNLKFIKTKQQIKKQINYKESSGSNFSYESEQQSEEEDEDESNFSQYLRKKGKFGKRQRNKEYDTTSSSSEEEQDEQMSQKFDYNFKKKSIQKQKKKKLQKKGQSISFKNVYEGSDSSKSEKLIKDFQIQDIEEQQQILNSIQSQQQQQQQQQLSQQDSLFEDFLDMNQDNNKKMESYSDLDVQKNDLDEINFKQNKNTKLKIASESESEQQKQQSESDSEQSDQFQQKQQQQYKTRSFNNKKNMHTQVKNMNVQQLKDLQKYINLVVKKKKLEQCLEEEEEKEQDQDFIDDTEICEQRQLRSHRSLQSQFIQDNLLDDEDVEKQVAQYLKEQRYKDKGTINLLHYSDQELINIARQQEQIIEHFQLFQGINLQQSKYNSMVGVYLNENKSLRLMVCCALCTLLPNLYCMEQVNMPDSSVQQQHYKLSEYNLEEEFNSFKNFYEDSFR